MALGEVPRSTRRITAVLVGGRRRVGRLFSLAHRQTKAFVARAPRGQTLRAIELRFRSGTRRYLGTGLTGRSTQCGFDFNLSAPYAGGA